MNKKILITGSGGFVGKNLYQLLKKDFNILGVGRFKCEFIDKEVDICDEQLIGSVLAEFNPDEVVHLAAFSNVEKCETERELANKHNILPVKILADWAGKNNKRLIFMSTDYVFDGVKGDFSENDLENPMQYYGKTKLMGEKIVSTLKKYAILRPTVIYGYDKNGMNFFMQLYRSQIEKKVIKVPIDQISNPTFVVDLCELIKKILVSDASGKYITTGNESFSRYDFAVKICDYMGWNRDLLIPVKTSLLGQVARRPLNNSTCNRLVVDRFNFSFNSLEENLSKINSTIIQI